MVLENYLRKKKYKISDDTLENLKNDFFKKGGVTTVFVSAVGFDPAEHSLRQQFYKTVEWKELRDDFISKYDTGQCANCSVKWNTMVESKLNVDHIQPVKFYWGKRLDPSNLQLLCELCNRYKGNATYDKIGIALYDALMLRDEQIKEKADSQIFEEKLALWELTPKQLRKLANDFLEIIRHRNSIDMISYHKHKILYDEAIKIACYKSNKE